MKTILNILLLILLVEMVAHGAETLHDEQLYKLDWGIMPPGDCWIGGGWSPYELPDTNMSFEEKRKLIEFENMQIAAASGRKFISRGISALVLGAMLVFFLKQYHLQWVGLIVCGFGIWSFAKGILEIKLAENWQVATGVAAVTILITIVAAMLWSSGIDLGKAKQKLTQKWKRISK